MKKNIKFAFTGLIISILNVYPSLASADENLAIDVSSLKSCELQDAESESPCKRESLVTRYGNLQLVAKAGNYGGTSLFFKGKLISDEKFSFQLGLVKLFHLTNNEIVLIHMTDGNAPDDYIFLKLMPNGSIKTSNSIRRAIADSNKHLANADKEGYSDSIVENGNLKPIQNGDQLVMDLGNDLAGTRRIATYQNDHISIKRIENKKKDQMVKEQNCMDTYKNYRSYINPNGGTGFMCGDQTIYYSTVENRSHMFLNATFENAVKYTCKTRKLIDYATFKKFVCINKN